MVSHVMVLTLSLAAFVPVSPVLPASDGLVVYEVHPPVMPVVVPLTAVMIPEFPSVVEVSAVAPPPPPPPPPPVTGVYRSRGDGLQVALAQVGKPYVYGAAGPDSFDCSGLVSFAFPQLPHSSSDIRNSPLLTPTSDPQPGDVVWTPGHVAIYVDSSHVVEASEPGTVVEVRRMWQTDPVFLTLGG